MQHIYPPNPKVFENWITREIHRLVQDDKLRDLSGFYRELGSLQIYSKIENFPDAVHVIHSADHTWITILPRMLAQKIFSDGTVDHIPIVSSNSIKLIDSYGDIITTLYFPRKVLATITDVQFEASNEPSLVAVSARCKAKEENAIEDMYYEMILDRDESILYRAMTPFRSCMLRQGSIVFTAPNAPAIIAETIGDFDYKLYAEIRGSLTVEGALLKVTVVTQPFPYFMLSFSNCVINGEEYEDIEIPSYFLYSPEDPITRDQAFEICPELIKHLIKVRAAAAAEHQKLQDEHDE